jgi:hypothetical protein
VTAGFPQPTPYTADVGSMSGIEEFPYRIRTTDR